MIESTYLGTVTMKMDDLVFPIGVEGMEVLEESFIFCSCWEAEGSEG